ncbi:MAG: CapA family protein [Phycisphaerales bacterium]|nr:MAG: CapA family protein [Phycisphaerales bacterium]
MVDILVGGDVCPIRRSRPYFREGDAQALFNDLMPEFEAADLTIVNLECPLIEGHSPISKGGGPILGASSQCIAGLKKARIDVAALANNHILDHGPEGLMNTIRVCREAGIDVVGAGENLETAGHVLSRTIDGIRIGVLGVAEHEFSIATEASAGANPLDLIAFVRTMRQHRDQFDYMLVLLHGGKEHYRYPSPELQKICRFMVEEGASAVICQHSHCPGCYETYQGGFIVYGQGNLIFDDFPNPRPNWCKGYLVRLTVTPGTTSEMHITPYIQSDAQVGARRMARGEALAFERELEEASTLIRDGAFVQRQWRQYCQSQRYTYFNILRGHSRPLRGLNKLLHFSDLLYSNKELEVLRNVVRCETHREVLDTILS